MAEITRLTPIRLASAEDVTELTHDPEIPAWRGPDDLSVEGRVAHDGKALLLRFDVQDDKHVQTSPDSKLFMGDSVQVAVFNPANSAHTLFDLGLRENKRGGFEALAWCHRAPDKADLGRWKLDTRIERSGSRTVYQIRVPFSMLGVTPPRGAGASLPLRFGFLVNENDGQGRVRWIQWQGGLGKNEDPSRLGYGILKF